MTNENKSASARTTSGSPHPRGIQIYLKDTPPPWNMQTQSQISQTIFAKLNPLVMVTYAIDQKGPL